MEDEDKGYKQNNIESIESSSQTPHLPCCSLLLKQCIDEEESYYDCVSSHRLLRSKNLYRRQVSHRHRHYKKKDKRRKKQSTLKHREIHRRLIRKGLLDDTEMSSSHYYINNDGRNYYDEDDSHEKDQQRTRSQPLLSSIDLLGTDNEQLYERLQQIAIDGDEITPEDYDLLLLLDFNKVKKTMAIMTQKDVDEQIELLTIVNNNQHTSSKSKDNTINITISSNNTEAKIPATSAKHCLICFETFDIIYVKIRRLSCGRMYCKVCIDEWLTTNSNKCPNLNCFWKCT